MWLSKQDNIMQLVKSLMILFGFSEVWKTLVEEMYLWMMLWSSRIDMEFLIGRVRLQRREMLLLLDTVILWFVFIIIWLCSEVRVQTVKSLEIFGFMIKWKKIGFWLWMLIKLMSFNMKKSQESFLRQESKLPWTTWPISGLQFWLVECHESGKLHVMFGL